MRLYLYEIKSRVTNSTLRTFASENVNYAKTEFIHFCRLYGFNECSMSLWRVCSDGSHSLISL